jgi:hypothetical protein
METIEQYFQRQDTPVEDSPTGRAMRELLKLKPNLPYEEARELVNDIGPSLYSPKGCAVLAARILKPETIEIEAETV